MPEETKPSAESVAAWVELIGPTDVRHAIETVRKMAKKAESENDAVASTHLNCVCGLADTYVDAIEKEVARRLDDVKRLAEVSAASLIGQPPKRDKIVVCRTMTRGLDDAWTWKLYGPCGTAIAQSAVLWKDPGMCVAEAEVMANRMAVRPDIDESAIRVAEAAG